MENDVVIEEKDMAAEVTQGELSMAYMITNLFADEHGTYKSRAELHNSPPVLIIDNGESEVAILLTKNITRKLISDLEHVNKGYSGYAKYTPMMIREMPIKERIAYSIKNDPLKFVIGLLGVAIVIAMLINR